MDSGERDGNGVGGNMRGRHSMQRGQQCRSPAHRRKCMWHRDALGEHRREPVGEEASEARARLAGPCSFNSE